MVGMEDGWTEEEMDRLMGEWEWMENDRGSPRDEKFQDEIRMNLSGPTIKNACTAGNWVLSAKWLIGYPIHSSLQALTFSSVDSVGISFPI